jgi:L-2-hydroxyglutarate oxidase
VIDYCLKYDLPIKLTGKSIKFNDSNKDELIKRCEDYNLDYSIKNNFIKLSEVCLVDYLKITQHQYENCKDKVDFYFNTKISEITTNKIFCENFTLDYNFLVNLTGVKANDIYREMSNDNSYTVCEILGRYHEFNIQHDNMVYNGPDKKLPFLGVHITPTFKKTIKLGPDAFPIIISKNISNNVKDVLMRFKFYMNNFNYFNKNLFNKSPQKMIEQSKQLEDLNIDMNSYVGQTFGVRSVLLNSKCEVEKNFIFKKYKNSIHLLNSHSPAATCTFAISDYIMNEIIK